MGVVGVALGHGEGRRPSRPGGAGVGRLGRLAPSANWAKAQSGGLSFISFNYFLYCFHLKFLLF